MSSKQGANASQHSVQLLTSAFVRAFSATHHKHTAILATTRIKQWF